MRLTKPRRRVSTLDPSKLTLTHYLELQGLIYPRVTFGPRSAQLYYAATAKGTRIKFPPHARGYLYFDRPDPCPHVASGRLKFRVAENDPDVRAEFDAGHDLRLPNGWQPWSMHLLALRRSSWWKPVYDLLRAEALIPDAHDQRIAQLLRDVPPLHGSTGANFEFHNRTTTATVLEPFPMDFSKNILRCILLDKDEVRPLFVMHPMSLGTLGVGLVRFEAAVVPLRRNPVLVVRFLEWLKPPTVSPLPETPTQVPGKLVTKLRSKEDWSDPLFFSPTLLPEKSWAMLKARDLPS